MREDIDRLLWDRTEEVATGCIEYTGSKVGVGYGKLYVGGRQWLAHRLAYADRIGPIPKGAIIRHSCDNPPCVNPDHLFIGTSADNSLDSTSRGRANGRRVLPARGHIRDRSGSKGAAFEVRVYVGDGKTRTATVRGETPKEARDEAQRKLTAMLSEVDADRSARRTSSGSTGTFRQLVTRWRKYAEADWSPTTIAAYDSYLRIHILPALGDMKVRDMTAADLDEFYGNLRARKLSPASIGKCHIIIRRALAEGVRWKWIRSNPASDARPPKISRPDLAPPSPVQVRKLLDFAAKQDALIHTLVVLAADTGARRGELVAIRWRNVDLEAGELVIDKALVLDGAKVVEKDTKTHRARRIALGAPAVAVLKEYRRTQREKALAVGRRLTADSFVFSTDVAGRTPLRPDGATSRFMRLRKEAKLPKVRFHDLRHALVTDWLAAGVDARTVMGRVGHASLQTLTRYSHFVAAADKDAADRLGDRHRAAK